MQETRIKGGRIVPKFCFPLARLTVQLTRRSERHKVEQLMKVVLHVSFHAKEPHQKLEKVEECKRSVTERTHDAMRRDGFTKKNLRRAVEGPDLSAILFRKPFRMFCESRRY